MAYILKISASVTIYFTLFSIFVFHLIPSHNADAFKAPCSNHTKMSGFLDGAFSWDGQYFLSIAEHGYVYENQLAFFPLFPVGTKLLSNAVSVVAPYLSTLLGHSNLIKVTGIILNGVFSVLTSKRLQELTLIVTRDENLAKTAVILHMFSPAKIFLISFYSESLYMFVTITGILHCVKGNPICGSIYFGLSAATRSNGILNVGYLVYFSWLILLRQKKNILHVIRVIMKTVACACICLLPFFVYMTYGNYVFCQNPKVPTSQCLIDYGNTKGYKIVGHFEPTWCKWKIPMFYSYVQDNHWNVGFLRYFEAKQIPNFCVAAPAVCLVLCFAIKYFCKRPNLMWNLGLTKRKEKEAGVFRSEMVPFVLHGVFLAVFGLFFMHVQVTTRMLASSSPLIYWIGAYICNEGLSNEDLTVAQLSKFFLTSNTTLAKIVKCYFLSYAVIGTVAFSVFLPWT